MADEFLIVNDSRNRKPPAGAVMHLPIAQHHRMTSKLLGTAGGWAVAADEPPAKCKNW